MGCKQHRACNNNFGRNFAFNASLADNADQCQPEATGAGTNSVCRQCCDQIFGDGTVAAGMGQTSSTVYTRRMLNFSILERLPLLATRVRNAMQLLVYKDVHRCQECGLDLLSQNDGNGTDRAGWEEDLVLHELKNDSTGGGNHTHAATGKLRV